MPSSLGATGRFWRQVALSTPGSRVLIIGSALVVLAATGPERLERGPDLCVYKLLTGRECYACGISRAVAAATRGRLALAWDYNPLVLPLLLAVAVTLARDVRALLLSRSTPPSHPDRPEPP